jgi:hypothetical protein
MRQGYHALLEHIIKRAAAALEKVNVPQAHPREEPAPKVPEVQTVAGAAWRDRDHLTIRPQQLRSSGQEKHVDIRVPPKHIPHRQGMGRIRTDLEIGRIHDDAIELSLDPAIVEEHPLIRPASRAEDEIISMDRVAGIVPGGLQRRPTMPHGVFKQRQQGRVALVKVDFDLTR